MKTTFDLPEDLVQEMKLRAVRERRKLKDVATEAFRRGLSSAQVETEPTLVELLGDPDTADREFPLPQRKDDTARIVEFP